MSRIALVLGARATRCLTPARGHGGRRSRQRVDFGAYPPMRADRRHRRCPSSCRRPARERPARRRSPAQPTSAAPRTSCSPIDTSRSMAGPAARRRARLPRRVRRRRSRPRTGSRSSPSATTRVQQTGFSTRDDRRRQRAAVALGQLEVGHCALGRRRSLTRGSRRARSGGTRRRPPHRRRRTSAAPRAWPAQSPPCTKRARVRLPDRLSRSHAETTGLKELALPDRRQLPRRRQRQGLAVDLCVDRQGASREPGAIAYLTTLARPGDMVELKATVGKLGSDLASAAVPGSDGSADAQTKPSPFCPARSTARPVTSVHIARRPCSCWRAGS